MDKTESFKKFLYNQVALAIGIIGVAFGVFNLLQAPKTDIKVIETLNTIRDNHLHTLEEEMKTHQSGNTADFQDLRDRLTRIETVLDERLPKKQ